MTGSQEINRLVERLMREDPVDWLCLYSTDEQGMYTPEIAGVCIEQVELERHLQPLQKAFRAFSNRDLVAPTLRAV